jgi:hypothetical protein
MLDPPQRQREQSGGKQEENGRLDPLERPELRSRMIGGRDQHPVALHTLDEVMSRDVLAEVKRHRMTQAKNQLLTTNDPIRQMWLERLVGHQIGEGGEEMGAQKHKGCSNPNKEGERGCHCRNGVADQGAYGNPKRQSEQSTGQGQQTRHFIDRIRPQSGRDWPTPPQQEPIQENKGTSREQNQESQLDEQPIASSDPCVQANR